MRSKGGGKEGRKDAEKERRRQRWKGGPSEVNEWQMNERGGIREGKVRKMEGRKRK